MAANGEIEGFLLPYMGQIDERLPYCPPDLVPRDRTFNYPTNFSPMSDENIRVLSLRGEQLTRLLLDCYSPNLQRSDEHMSELQSLMSLSHAVFCLKITISTKNYSFPTYNNKQDQLSYISKKKHS